MPEFTMLYITISYTSLNFSALLNGFKIIQIFLIGKRLRKEKKKKETHTIMIFTRKSFISHFFLYTRGKKVNSGIKG